MLSGGDPSFFLDNFFRSPTTVPTALGGWSGGNFAQFASTRIDGALDALAAAQPGTAREAAAKEAMEIIIDEAPATWITSATWHVGVSGRNGMDSYEPSGSDYFVIKQTMPESDWPTAFTHERVYTLDGSMVETGGIAWDESRFAEPDSMIKDLIDVLHPVNDEYAPSGLYYLRHAATSVPRYVKAEECSAKRVIRATACDKLGIEVSELSKAVAKQKDDKKQDIVDLRAATGVLATVAAISLLALAVFYAKYYRPARSGEVENTSKAPQIGAPPATPGRVSIAGRLRRKSICKYLCCIVLTMFNLFVFIGIPVETPNQQSLEQKMMVGSA